MIKSKIRRKLITIISIMATLLVLVLINDYSFSIINRSLVYGLFAIVFVLIIAYYVGDYEDFTVMEDMNTNFFNILDYFNIFIFAILTLQVIYTFAIFPLVQKRSMVPTLNEGDRIVVVMNKKLERFDIVVFEVDSKILYNIPLGDDNSLWVKRVIGLPGEKIEYINGILYVDNIKVDEPFLFDENGEPYLGSYKTSLPIEFNGKVIPEGYYLCMGDNRSNSIDSRVIGLIPKSLVVGRGKYIIRSLFDWQKIGV